MQVNIFHSFDICLHKVIAKLNFLFFLWMGFHSEHVCVCVKCLYKFKNRLSYLIQNSLIIPNAVLELNSQARAYTHTHSHTNMYDKIQIFPVARQCPIKGDRPLIFDLWEEVQGFRVKGTARAAKRQREKEKSTKCVEIRLIEKCRAHCCAHINMCLVFFSQSHRYCNYVRPDKSSMFPRWFFASFVCSLSIPLFVCA